MIKKGVNTDLFIKDLTFVDKNTSEVIDLSNANDVKLSVRKQGTTEWIDQEKTIVDNKISFQWNSDENSRIGTFDALLSFNKISSLSENGKIEYKYDAISLFQIVNTSDEESGVDAIGAIQVVYYGGADGLSAYELAVKQGYIGAEEDFAKIEQNNAANEILRQEAESQRKTEFDAIKQGIEELTPTTVYFKIL